MESEMNKDILNLNRQTLDDLRSIWQRKKLTIVVGAGASSQSGIPTWQEVLNKMLFNYIENQYKTAVISKNEEIRKAIQHRLFYESPIIVAHYFQGKLSNEEYLELVHQALYCNLQQAPTPGPIVRAIARLGSHLNSIVTFNYDNLIEIALTEEGIENTSIWHPPHWDDSHGIPVYHPHGMLPFDRKKDGNYWILLAESDYHTLYSSAQSWSNVALSKSLLESTCLFVSTSITDPNLRRMLDLMHREIPDKYHYFLWEKPLDEMASNNCDEMVRIVFNEVFTESHKRLGLKPLWFNPENADPDDKNSKWRDIPLLINAIRE
jgi:hypothetical protein